VRRAALALLAGLSLGGEAVAETLIITLSTGEVQINSNFTGAAVSVFGAIERDAATIARPGVYDIAVVLQGPDQDVVTRRKEQFLGVWVNRASATLTGVPSFYAVHSTRPLTEIGDASVLDRLELGLEHVTIAPQGSDPATAADFAAAFRRLKAESGLFVEQAGEDVVRVFGTSVFQTTFVLPAHIPTGTYEATVFLFSGGALLGSATTPLTVSKTGFEQFIFVAAQRQPLIYGAAAVLLALFIGWLAGIIFRRD
jgi:uncharacterized protein (TIGR02186 family)